MTLPEGGLVCQGQVSLQERLRQLGVRQTLQHMQQMLELNTSSLAMYT